MYMPAQIQLQTVKMVEIEPESDVPPSLEAPLLEAPLDGVLAFCFRGARSVTHGSPSLPSA